MNVPHRTHTTPTQLHFRSHTSLRLLLFRCTQFAPMKLVYNPGGFNSSCHSRKYEAGFSGSRTRYTNAEKLNIISVVQKLMQDELLSLVQAAAVVKIDPSMICRWLKNVENLRADPRKASKMAAHAGPTSVIAEIEKDLLDFAKMWREKGFEVNRFTLLRKAKELKQRSSDRTLQTYHMGSSQSSSSTTSRSIRLVPWSRQSRHWAWRSSSSLLVALEWCS